LKHGAFLSVSNQPGGENQTIYPFTAAGTYIGYTKKTNANSTAYFNLPTGDYKFRYTHNGVQFWSASAISSDTAEIIIPQPTAVTVKLGNEQLGAGLTLI
jgi:hypothetical protein